MTCLTEERVVKHLASELSSLCADEWGETLECWRVIQGWRRFYSQIQLVQVHTNHSIRKVIVKCPTYDHENALYYQDPRVAQREFWALREAAAALSEHSRHAVPRAYRVAPEEQLLLMEYVSGSDCDLHLGGARWWGPSSQLRAAESAFERLGQWLGNYQLNTAREVGADVIRSALAESRRRLEQLRRAETRQIRWPLDKILGRLEALAAQITTPIEGSACHGDFGPWNVLVTASRLTVIDFFCHHSDSIWVDPLNVVTYLEAQLPSLTLERRRMVRLRDAFLTGYGRRLDPADPVYQFCLATRRISRLQDVVQRPTTWARRYCRWFLRRRLLVQLTGE